MTRTALLALLLTAMAPVVSAWVESVEFPWNECPRPLWERELVQLKNIGIMHVSLPPGQDGEALDEAIHLIRRLNMEADLEGPVPESLETQTRAHGGPLTDALPRAVRISALAPTAMTRVRDLLISGAGAVVWTDVEDTLGPGGYRAGAINFAGEETPAAQALRRSAQLAMYWNATFSSLHPVTGAGIVLEAGSSSTRKGRRVLVPSVRQFADKRGISVVSVVNRSGRAWSGELNVLSAPGSASRRVMSVRGVSAPAHDALWLPVNVPLTAGPLCRNCSAFSNSDRLVYATAELTTMEYENGLLAMEFTAPAAGEVVLQLSQEPSGPLLAGGKPTSFDWDEHSLRVRLKIPAGKGPDSHVRIALAIEPPDATAFFDKARVLMIGETNTLTAQFSSKAIAQRSRLRVSPAFPMEQEPAKEPLELTYRITVPATAVSGDHAELALEADGIQMSHVSPQLLTPVALSFPDAVDVHLASNSALPLYPATVPVNRRTGGDVAVSIRNNAPAIRTFMLEPKVEGLEFSPAKMEVTVGASAAREVSFRVFTKDAAPGLHAGEVAVSGEASTTEPVQFAVIPEPGAVAYAVAGFSFIESAKTRASFMPGRWLELLNKDNDQNLLASSGVAFSPGPIETRGETLVFEDKTVKLDDLESIARKSKR